MGHQQGRGQEAREETYMGREGGIPWDGWGQGEKEEVYNETGEDIRRNEI